MGKRTIIVYEDLLGVPFKMGGRDRYGMDCFGQAMELNRRAGLELVDDPGNHEPGDCGMEKIGETWRDACWAGDMILSDPEGKGHPTHISTMVNSMERLVLTTTTDHGPVAIRAWSVQGVVGVWRARK